MSRYGNASMDQFLKRFEDLKQHWFRPKRGGGIDPDTNEEVVPLYTKAQLAEMFERMGVEIPESRDAKPVFKNQSGY